MGRWAEIHKMLTGRRHRQLNRHILAYMWCMFEAYLCWSSWQQNLITPMECVWTGRNKKNDKPTDWQCHRHILAQIRCKFDTCLCWNNWQQHLNTSTEAQTGRNKKMTGHRLWHWHWPTDRQLDRHILAYMWCKFEAYLCRNNWSKDLNMAMGWADMWK